MIKLIIKGKEKLVTNKKGLEILRKFNPKEKFRIALCRETGKKVIQNWHETYKNWLCLHD